MSILVSAPALRRVLTAAVFASVVTALPSFVQAQDGVEAEPVAEVDATAPTTATTVGKPISAALLLGFGTDLGEDANPWGFGFGVRGGYNLDNIFLGARFMYHLGSSYGGGLAELDFNLWEFSLEGGYDVLVADRLTVRPSFGLGIVSLIVSSDNDSLGIGGSASSSDIKLMLAPGVSLLYDITPDIFAGGELRLPIVVGGGSMVGLTIYATVGMRF